MPCVGVCATKTARQTAARSSSKRVFIAADSTGARDDLRAVRWGSRQGSGGSALGLARRCESWLVAVPGSRAAGRFVIRQLLVFLESPAGEMQMSQASQIARQWSARGTWRRRR